MEGNQDPGRLPSEPEGVIDLERSELLILLRDVQKGSAVRRVVDLDRKGLLTSLRDLQDAPESCPPPSAEDDNFLWLG